MDKNQSRQDWRICWKIAVMKKIDALIIGGGAAGLFCAGVAGQLGKTVVVIDHAQVLGEKIRISGGGRCNFTNVGSTHQNFLSQNPHFVKSALSRFSPQDFIELVQRYQIPFHEKHLGQLFCDRSATEIIQMLLNECKIGGVEIRYPESAQLIESTSTGWRVFTDHQEYDTHNVVMATGGLPVPAIGATDFALRFASELNIPVVPVRPALVPLAFTSNIFSQIEDFAGLSVNVDIGAGQKKQRYGRGRFKEDLLITHKGLSGPAVLQASSYWEEGEPLDISWLDKEQWLALTEEGASRAKPVEQLLSEFFPVRLAKEFTNQLQLLGKRWAEVSKKDQEQLVQLLCSWSVKPAGTLGWNKAEVMVGGIDTSALDSKTMMVKLYHGLFFIGECVDVTGHLGGHNFQWAWSSGYACAHGLL